MAARKNLHHSELTRQRIKTSMLLNRLQSFVEGAVELSPAQVTAALGLLKKTIPDMKENSTTIRYASARDISDDELANIATGSSEGAAGEAGGEEIAESIH